MKLRPTSLTLRLTLLFGIAAAVVFAAFGWTIERSIEAHFLAEDVAELEAIARTASETLSHRGAVDVPTALKQRFRDILVGHHSAALYVTGQDRRSLFASPGGPDLSSLNRLATGQQTLRQWNDANHTYRVLTRRLGADSRGGRFYTLSVAVVIDSHQHFLTNFRRALWLMITSGIVVMGLIGWIAVRQGHAPLRDIVARIHRISANELNTRLSPETVPRELSDLAVSFNGMLERMEEAFQRLSNFSADIAHELRTPVTSLLTQTQVALSQSRSVNEYREILYSNIEEYERMAQMIGDMLLLAKTDNGQYPLDTAEVDLAQEVRDLFEYYEAWAEERGVTLTLDGTATVVGDRAMLRRVLGNLLSNAIKHTPSGSTVRVMLKQIPQAVRIRVENSGSMISLEHLPRLFDRFYRVDASRQRGNDGTGLGLAIAKSIVDIHGGKIEASSMEQNTCFQITLPRV
ncbi:MAG: heavy metal sensor histidine kinase [Gammaproteobacteria bacterium]|nr:heavy metal sensor histidine kinase [Gammaproteobacteria bacterium]